MLRNRRMARFIEPVMVALIGVALLSLSPVLAAYLIFAGLSLRCYEYDVFERERHRELDVSDGLIMAQYQGEVVEQYEGASGLQPSQARPGLPTGVSADLQANIKRRQANRS